MLDQKSVQFLQQLNALEPAHFTTWTNYILAGDAQANIGYVMDALRNSTPEYNETIDKLGQCLANAEFWCVTPPPLRGELARQLIELGVGLLNIRPLALNSLLAGSESFKKQSGPNLVFQAVSNLFASPNKQYLIFGLAILDILITKKALKWPDSAQELVSCLETALRNQEPQLVENVGEIMKHIGEVFTRSDYHYFAKLGETYVEVAANLLSTAGYVQPIINCIKCLMEDFHLILKSSLPKLTLYLKAVFLHPAYPDKREIIDILRDISSKFPSFYKKDNSCFLALLEVIFLEMIKISEVITEQWLNPVPNSEYDDRADPNQQPVLYGMETLDVILDKVDCKALFEVFKNAVKGMNNNPDWRHKYAALMALSQISEYLKSKSNIRDIFEIIFENIKHPNPRIRYACFQAIGQTVDDKREIVFKLFFDKLLQTILEGFNDPVPYVSSHAFACFTNFAENCEYRKIKPYIPQIISHSELHLAASLPLMIENALSCIHEVFNILDTNILTINYQPLMATIEHLLESPHKKVRSQALETLSKLMFEIIRADGNLLPNFVATIMKMNTMCLTTIQSQPELVDPEYVLATFRKVIVSSKGDLPNQQQIKTILQYIRALLEGCEEEQRKTICFDLLAELLEDTKAFSPDFLDICGKFIESFNDIADKELAIKAQCLYQNLAKKVVKFGGIAPCKEGQIIVEGYLTKLLKMISYQPTDMEADEDQQDFQIRKHQHASNANIVQALKQFVVHCSTYFVPDWTAKIVTEIRAYTIRALQGHSEIFEWYQEDTEDETARSNFEGLLNQYEEVLEEAACVAENLYKLFKNQIVVRELLNFFANEVCEKCLASPREQLIKIGLYIIDDALDYYTYYEIQAIWMKCLQLYLKHSTSEIHSIRQAGCFGLGIWIKKSPIEQVNAAYKDIEKILVNCLSIAPDQDNEGPYFCAQDNVAAAIGHLITANMAHPDVGQLLDYWLDYLPLKRDKTQAKEQHLKLIEWFSMDSYFFSPSNPAGLRRLSKVLRIFAEIYNTRRLQNPQVKQGIQQHMKNMQKHPLAQKHSDEIWGSLTEEDRARLLEIEMSDLQI